MTTTVSTLLSPHGPCLNPVNTDAPLVAYRNIARDKYHIKKKLPLLLKVSRQRLISSAANKKIDITDVSSIEYQHCNRMMIKMNGSRQKTLEVGQLEMERPILLTSTSRRVSHLTLTLPSFAALEEGTMNASNCIQDLHLQQNLWQQFEIYMMPLD